MQVSTNDDSFKEFEVRKKATMTGNIDFDKLNKIEEERTSQYPDDSDSSLSVEDKTPEHFRLKERAVDLNQVTMGSVLTPIG